jgi:hypothetical protein
MRVDKRERTSRVHQLARFEIESSQFESQTRARCPLTHAMNTAEVQTVFSSMRIRISVVTHERLDSLDHVAPTGGFWRK